MEMEMEMEMEMGMGMRMGSCSLRTGGRRMFVQKATKPVASKPHDILPRNAAPEPENNARMSESLDDVKPRGAKAKATPEPADMLAVSESLDFVRAAYYADKILLR